MGISNGFEHCECPSCGASVDMPTALLSTNCAFCDAPIVKSKAVENKEHPDYVAPFMIDKWAAGNRLKSHIAKTWFVSKKLKQDAIQEELKGVLVPFWAYEAHARSKINCNIGVWWTDTETYTEEENGQTVTKTRTVQRTEWFNYSGSHAHHYKNHLVCGSNGIPEEETNALEPFDLGKALPFEPELLAGWLSERFTVSVKSGIETAKNEMFEEERKNIVQFLPGDVYNQLSVDTDFNLIDVKTIHLPIWLATYRNKDQVFRLLVNGQTGQVTGIVPKSAFKIIVAILAGLLILLITIFILSR